MQSLVKSYQSDITCTQGHIKNVITKLTKMRLTKENAITELIDEIYRVLSLELHTICKQKQIYDFLYSMTTFEEQAYIIREILDQSPISYVNTLIPWIVRQMTVDKQVNNPFYLLFFLVSLLN